MSTTSPDKHYRPQDAAAGWAMTFLRPLLPPRRRAVFEDAMSGAFDTWPEWCHTYVAGTLVCLVATLPNNDPWRHISARSGNLVAGQCPPATDGVVRDDRGRRFGSWRDATDLIVPVFTEPESDPSLIELADPLTPLAGLLLATAGVGDWRATRDMMAEIATGLGAAVDDFGRPFSAVLGRLSRDTAREAIAWALHRRKAYGGEVYCEEILFRWTTLATRISPAQDSSATSGFTPAAQRWARQAEAEVAATIERYRVADSSRDGIGRNFPEDDTDLDAWGERPI